MEYFVLDSLLQMTYLKNLINMKFGDKLKVCKKINFYKEINYEVEKIVFNDK